MNSAPARNFIFRNPARNCTIIIAYCVKGVLHPTAKIRHIYAFFLYHEEKLYILYIILTRLGISDPKIGLFFSLDVRCSCKERVNFIFPLQGHGPRTSLILTEFIPVLFPDVGNISAGFKMYFSFKNSEF